MSEANAVQSGDGLEAPCDCRNWARSVDLKYLTNHHPQCARYNDSLIEVWKVSDGTSSFYTENEQDAKTEAENCEDITITKAKIHREVFENLPEFDGF